jgi:hypothetical protein
VSSKSKAVPTQTAQARCGVIEARRARKSELNHLVSKTCANADLAFVDVSVTQRVGRFTITGFVSFFSDACDGVVPSVVRRRQGRRR